MKNPTSAKTVHSLERGLDILMVASRANRPIGITDLSHELGIAKGSVSRLVTTLVQHKFLTRDPETAKYRLGVKLWELGHRVVHRQGLAEVARPVLEELRAATRETAHVAVLTEHGETVFLETLDSPQATGPNIQLGVTFPAYCTANGKAMLAFLPQAERDRLLKGKRRRYTDSTIIRKDDLVADLHGVRRLGYAVNRGEYRSDVYGVAAPVLDDAGAVVGALGVSIPTTRASPQVLRQLGGLVSRAAKEVSASYVRGS